ncbi:hypothetical protein [Candidatus Methylopumilus planktonicus]|uniref:hypothetical protein n=1 Tax=Candidatus Methylopumilus planktonicus TaxID=1581557 RepID=UPI003D18A510
MNIIEIIQCIRRGDEPISLKDSIKGKVKTFVSYGRNSDSTWKDGEITKERETYADIGFRELYRLMAQKILSHISRESSSCGHTMPEHEAYFILNAVFIKIMKDARKKGNDIQEDYSEKQQFSWIWKIVGNTLKSYGRSYGSYGKNLNKFYYDPTSESSIKGGQIIQKEKTNKNSIDADEIDIDLTQEISPSELDNLFEANSSNNSEEIDDSSEAGIILRNEDGSYLESPNDESEDDESPAYLDTISEDIRKCIENARKSMKEKMLPMHYKVLKEAIFDGLSIEEISIRSGRSYDAIKSALTGYRKKAKQFLEPCNQLRVTSNLKYGK